jgi:phospholipid/cholesterol/gamma-HCH transport system permease protein
MNFPFGILSISGRWFLDFLAYLGELGALMGELLESIKLGAVRGRLMLQQIVTIGYGSQAVVIVTGAFTGAVFTAQSYFKFKDFGIESSVGGIVSVSVAVAFASVASP